MAPPKLTDRVPCVAGRKYPWDEDPQQRVDTGVRTGPTAPRVDFEVDVTPAGEVDDPATGVERRRHRNKLSVGVFQDGILHI